MKKRTYRGMPVKSYYSQEEYDNALRVAERFAKDGCVFEPAEAVLAVGTLEMQKRLLEYVKKYDGMNIVEFLNSFNKRDEKKNH